LSWRRLAWTALLGATCGATGVSRLQAQLDTSRLLLSGEVRVRSEVDARTASRAPDHATLLRTRLGVRAAIDARTRAFIQISDSRAFGDETNSLADASADLLDVHQAYVDWTPSARWRFRLGRQEWAFADERLIGPVGWANVTRAFDGLRATLTADGWTVDGLAAVLDERDALQPMGLDPRANEGQASDRTLYGIWATRGSIDLFLLVDGGATEGAITRIDRWTAGGYVRRSFGAFRMKSTLAWQGGEQRGAAGNTQRIDAWLASVALARGFRGRLKPALRVQIDALSGDRTPTNGVYGAFNTLYATNHPYYGLMDLFLNVPVQTGGLGLIDFVEHGELRPGPWGLDADLHQLRLAQRGPTGGGGAALGSELDLTATRPLTPALGLQLGYSAFAPAAAARAAPILLGTRVLHWGYVQATVRF